MTNLNDAENDIDYFNLGLVVDSIPAEGINGMEGIDGMEGINGMEWIDGMEGIEGDLLDYNEIDNKADQGEPEAEYWNPKGFTEFKTFIDLAFLTKRLAVCSSCSRVSNFFLVNFVPWIPYLTV